MVVIQTSVLEEATALFQFFEFKVLLTLVCMQKKMVVSAIALAVSNLGNMICHLSKLKNDDK